MERAVITIRIAVSSLLLLVMAGCAATHPVSEEGETQSVLSRLQERRDSISTATYRVRWRAVGTEPHAEFILEIAYGTPAHFRIVATGPFGLPAFTAVVDGDAFTFQNHRDGRFITDDIANLIDYEFPVAEFFEGPWRDLFAGGWGGSRVVDLLVQDGTKAEFRAASDQTSWVIRWDRGNRAPDWIAADVEAESGHTSAKVWFDEFSPKRPPFWKLDRLVLKGVSGTGEHRWTILEQKYNITIPERFFEPLQPPPPWKRF